MQRARFVIAGGGAAGLALAYHLVAGGYTEDRIVVIDIDEKRRNDRTWCRWTLGGSPFDAVAAKVWDAMWFHGPERSHRFALAPYVYTMMRGEDYYTFTRNALAAAPNVDFVQARVDTIDQDTDRAIVATTAGIFHADYVFDSLFIAREFRVDESRYRFLKQHFRGWVVRTDAPCFDADAFTMFDVTIPQEGGFQFMYVLPYDARTALVEHTFFSIELQPQHVYEAAIRRYLKERFDDPRYTVIEEERGIIPMTDQPFRRRVGRRVLNIGTKGGRVKASTGYAFDRMERDAKRIVASLRRHGHPFGGIDVPARYAAFDAIFLEVLAAERDVREVFVQLYERNALPRLWRFLDQEAGAVENLALITTTRWSTFMSAAARVAVRRVRTIGARA